MKIGDTFLRADSDDHLWIVLSDPAKDSKNVLLVNMTTVRAWKERTCVFDRGDHSWVHHETCINYTDAIVTTLDRLLDAKDGGALKMHDPLSPNALARALEGAAQSIHLSLENFGILESQGLVDF